MNKSHLLGAVCACLISAHAESALVTYDADDFTLFDIANNLLPGATLSAISGSAGITDDTIISYKSGTGISNDYAFGYTQTNGNIFTQYRSENSGVHERRLRIDLDTGTNYFGALFHNAGHAFLGRILAFDSDDNLLTDVITELPPGTPPNQCCLVDPTWLSISRPTNDISYLMLNAYGGTVVSVDAIEFNVVPIPASVWLFGSGLLGLVSMARRKKA